MQYFIIKGIYWIACVNDCDKVMTDSHIHKWQDLKKIPDTDKLAGRQRAVQASAHAGTHAPQHTNRQLGNQTGNEYCRKWINRISMCTGTSPHTHSDKEAVRPRIQPCEWEVLPAADRTNTQMGRQCQEIKQAIVWLVRWASQHVSRRACAVALMRQDAQGTSAAVMGATASKDRA